MEIIVVYIDWKVCVMKGVDCWIYMIIYFGKDVLLVEMVLFDGRLIGIVFIFGYLFIFLSIFIWVFKGSMINNVEVMSF